MELPKMAGTVEAHLSHAQIQQQKQYCIMALIGVLVFLSVHFNNSAVAVTAAALAFGYIANFTSSLQIRSAWHSWEKKQWKSKR